MSMATDADERVLLDTHVWIWAVDDDRRLGPRSRGLLRRISTPSALRISAVSVFELVALHTAGRLLLSRTPEQWVRDALRSPWVSLAELSPAIAIDGGYVSREALADPMDRLLVATARHLDLPLMTADRRIVEYGKRSGAVRVHDASR
jgi:PIN domain nuclease of toxin-antitoxin system